MKKLYLLIALIICAASVQAQSRIFFEAGASVGMEGMSINYSVNYYNPKSFIAGAGLNIFGIMNYNRLSKPSAQSFPILYTGFDLTGIEETGPYGAGAGLRIYTNLGIAIEGGVMGTWESKYTMFKIFDSNFKYAWYEDDFKVSPYARLIISPPENLFTFGIGTNSVEVGSLYVGIKFGNL